MEWRPQTREEYLKEENPVAHTCPNYDTDSVFWINDAWALVVNLVVGWALIPGIGYCPFCGVALPVPE